MTHYLHGIYKKVNETIIDNNAKYKALVDNHRRRMVFEVDDLIWAILTRNRFLVGEYNKLKERKISPHEVLEMIMLIEFIFPII
jgi:hypothetical protein